MNLPMVPDSYPRPLTAIHQIEVTTFCNLRCQYCPSPKLDQPHLRNQPRMHMEMQTFERALEWCQRFYAQGTQAELSLTGIGETLLHPNWWEMVIAAREALPRTFINFSTNGLLLDEAACEHLANYDIRVFISLHRPEKAGRALEIAKRYRVVEDINASAALDAFDWAGQVDWFVSAPPVPCEWLSVGWANVLVDGRITTCCLDATGNGTIAHVDDPVGFAQTAPWSLCESCHMTIDPPKAKAVTVNDLKEAA